MPPRIVTLTLNPAVDLASSADAVRPTHKIRTFDEHMDPGGGGINVARVITALGGDACAVILAGGVTGALLKELLDEACVPERKVTISGRTRINLAVFDRSSGSEYRFVSEGPVVTENEWRSALEEVNHMEADWIVASGSITRGMPENIYAMAARDARRRGRRFVLDSSGPALRAALGQGLSLIKPSLGELESLVGHPLPDAEAQSAEALRLVQSGAAAMIALTLGHAGAMLVTADGVIHMPALRTTVRSAVGAGDAFLGALVLMLARGEPPVEALAWAIAAGAASVESVGTARLTPVRVRAARAQMEEDYPAGKS